MKDSLRAIVLVGIFSVPFVVLLVTTSLFFPYITGKNFAFRIIVEVTLAAWIVLMLYDAHYRPRISWIVVALLGFLGTMLLANTFGEYPPKSFWGNYERMDGYITLVHFFCYFLITATMLSSEKLWGWFWNTTLGVACIVVLHAFAQLSGATTVSQGAEWRVDATLGNSTYMAVYMLFHIFIAALLLIQARTRNMQYVYGGLILVFAFILFQTGTRGAALGLIGGTLLSVCYIAIFGKGHPTIRKIALGSLVALVLFVSGFIAIRNTSFVQDSPMMSRLANITLTEGSIRFMIWGIALEGFKERPLLGWGQENFSYVFNKYHIPQLYRAESWYDRAHNIVLNWLIAGGLIGALCYLSIFAAALWHAIVRPRIDARNGDVPVFSVPEQGLLLGILAAYFFHNLFVFDNLVSFIFFAALLAFVHSKVAREWPWIMSVRVDKQIVQKVIAPVVAICAVVVVYVLNVPGIAAAKDMIDALKVDTYYERFAAFERALESGSFADQEISEQYAEYAAQLARNSDAPEELKDQYVARAEEVLLEMIARKPNDPRLHTFLVILYRSSEQQEKAATELARVRELSPNKVDTILDQGAVALALGNLDEMETFITTAYEMAPHYSRARILYTNTHFFVDEIPQLDVLITERFMRAYATDPSTYVAINNADAFPVISAYFNEYIETHPQSTIAPIAFAIINYTMGREGAMRDILESAAERNASLADEVTCYLSNIENDRPLLEVCSES